MPADHTHVCLCLCILVGAPPYIQGHTLSEMCKLENVNLRVGLETYEH